MGLDPTGNLFRYDGSARVPSLPMHLVLQTETDRKAPATTVAGFDPGGLDRRLCPGRGGYTTLVGRPDPGEVSSTNCRLFLQTVIGTDDDGYEFEPVVSELLR